MTQPLIRRSSAGPAPLPDRRAFLKTTGAAVTGVLVGSQVDIQAAETLAADQLVAGKDARLVVHTADPLVFETPVELLAGERLTPAPLLFVRNTQQPGNIPTIKPAELTGWKIELTGLVDRPAVIDARTLVELDQVEVEMVLQCSGNSRELFAAAAKTKGTQWGRGAMGNVRFGGVRLATVVDHLGLKIKPEAKYLSAEGRDEPPKGQQDFEHSIPLAEALKKSLLALRLNGQSLPAIHGGPVRLVTPGYYGTMHVKWLSRLRCDAEESDHTSQIPNYRTPREPIRPGAPYDFTFANSDPNWRMKIKCVVLAPLPGARLPAGEVSVSGVAFNDGETKIEKVLVSTDMGQAWRSVPFEAPKGPFAWYRWSTRLQLAPGKHQIWAKVMDALGRTQPLDGTIDWNPQGYTWNGVEKIDVTVA